jgi:hypothetical protein
MILFSTFQFVVFLHHVRRGVTGAKSKKWVREGFAKWLKSRVSFGIALSIFLIY